MPLNSGVVSYPTMDWTTYFRSIKKFIRQKAGDRPTNKCPRVRWRHENRHSGTWGTGATSLWEGRHVYQERFPLEETFGTRLRRWAGVFEEGKEGDGGTLGAKAQSHEKAQRASSWAYPEREAQGGTQEAHITGTREQGHISGGALR